MTRPARGTSGRRIRSSLPLLAFAALAGCPDSGPPPPDLGSFERYNADYVVGLLIETKLGETRTRPGRASSWLGLGMAFEANDFLDEAVACYEHAAALDDRDARIWYRLANTRMSMGDAEQAVELFRAAIERAPKYPPARWRLGYSQLRLGRLDEAESSFREAITIDEDQPLARLGLARVALQRGDGSEAAAILEALLVRHSRMSYARYLLGTAYRQLGRMKEARRELEASSIGPDPSGPGQRPPAEPQAGRKDPWQDEMEALRVSFRMVLGQARQEFESGNVASAVTILEKLHRERPKDATVNLNLGMLYVETGRAQEAVRLLDAALRANPESFLIVADLAAAQLSAGNAEEALRSAERAIEIDPSAPRAFELRGKALVELQRVEQAKTALLEAIELGADDPQEIRAILNTLEGPQ